MAALQKLSEIRDGMRIDWNVSITMDDGLVLRADIFRPLKDGQFPVILTYGPYAKNLAFQDGYPSAWNIMAEKHPDVTAGSSQQISKLGSGRSGKMGAARLRLRARQFTRRRLLAGRHRSFFAARDEGFLRLHRMGRRAALVERQGRAQRHFLLRHEPVARRLAAAAASRRHVRVGGFGRLVPRHDASWRHSLHVLGELVRYAGQDRAVRRRRARQAQPRARRIGVRTGDADGRAAGQEPRRFRRPDSRASARRQISPRPLAGVGQDHDAFVLRRQLGRPGPASARQFRRLRARGLQAEMAGGARHRALDAFLHRLRPRAAVALLRLFPARQGHELEQAAEGAAATALSGREIRRPRRERMAAQAHQMDQVSISIRPAWR